MFFSRSGRHCWFFLWSPDKEVLRPYSKKIRVPRLKLILGLEKHFCNENFSWNGHTGAQGWYGVWLNLPTVSKSSPPLSSLATWKQLNPQNSMCIWSDSTNTRRWINTTALTSLRGRKLTSSLFVTKKWMRSSRMCLGGGGELEGVWGGYLLCVDFQKQFNYFLNKSNWGFLLPSEILNSEANEALKKKKASEGTTTYYYTVGLYLNIFCFYCFVLFPLYDLQSSVGKWLMQNKS